MQRRQRRVKVDFDILFCRISTLFLCTLHHIVKAIKLFFIVVIEL